MGQEGLDRHQLAGLDDRERGFSRPVEFERDGDGYRAILRYETTRIETSLYPAQNGALEALIQALQARGYRQLRTQVSYRNGMYLGSQELWVEYPDAQQVEPEPPWLVTRILSWFRFRSAKR